MQGKDGAAGRADHGHMKKAPALLAACLLAGVFAAPARAGDAANGLKLSGIWCSACHVVAADQIQASVAAPTFADIARRAKGPKPLTLFLTQPHGQMPNMTLSQPEIADIVAYIFSLGPNPLPSDQKREPAGGLSGAIAPQK